MPGIQDLKQLQRFFEPGDIGWKPIAVSKKTGKALVAAYVSNRAIMDRLDDVCGPGNWKNEFKAGPSGGLLCGISVRVVREDGTCDWVTKWDGAENTDVEPVKGGISSSMRRAAVQWGIGRYLYDLPSPWVPVDEKGRIVKSPTIPRVFMPGRSGDGAGPQVAEPDVVARPKTKATKRPSAQTGPATQQPAGKPRSSSRNRNEPRKPNPEKDASDYYLPDNRSF